MRMKSDTNMTIAFLFPVSFQVFHIRSNYIASRRVAFERSVVANKRPKCRHLLSHTFLTKGVFTTDLSVPDNLTSLHCTYKDGIRKRSLCLAL